MEIDIDQMLKLGATSFPFLSFGENQRLLQEAAAHPLTRAPEFHGKRNVVQNYEFAKIVPSLSPSIMKQIERLERFLNENIPCLPEDFSFNERMIHVYDYPTENGIGVHRDSARFKHLIALFVLNDSGRFYVCKDEFGTKPTEIETSTGFCILMTAPGFYDKSMQPFHFVSHIMGPRTTIGLRFNSKPNEPM